MTQRAAIHDHIVTLRGQTAPEAEDYNALRYALEMAGGETGVRVVAVTSPTVGDGKTTTAVNLAGVLARRREARVLLIDGDLRRPSVARSLGLDAEALEPGLVDAILDPALTLERVVKPLTAFNLSVLLAGRYSDDPFELLRTARTGQLLQEARRRYDTIIIDTSPLLLVPDTRILEGSVDGFVLVVAANRTPRKLVSEALQLLNPSKLIGLVFNNDERPLSGYRSYYGYDSPEARARRAAGR
jgi:capsular exopolysaccharide synthesis family protein